MYELGATYEAEEQNDKAITVFETLLSNHKSSSYLPKALLKQGLIYYNTDKDDAALVKLKTSC